MNMGSLDLPIIIHTGKDLSEGDEARLRTVADKFILKEANSPERLLAETSLFLHRAESSLPEQKREMLDRSLRRDPALDWEQGADRG